MRFFKSMGLFLITNLLIVISISLILNLLGVPAYLTQAGIDYSSLLVFCFIWGMSGALISLALSRIMAKMVMGVKVIQANTARTQTELNLLQLVSRLAKQAGLPQTPEVGIYEAADMNAFATGPTRSRALVAVSTGLLEAMDAEEIEGVLAHEIAHIANGDMLTMTLLQGLMNAFIMFLARILAYAASTALNNRNSESRGPGFLYPLMVFAFEFGLMFLGMIVIAAFSRYREYRADAGGASFAGRTKMIAALRRLQQEQYATNHHPSVTSLQINNLRFGGLKNLFATHPPLADRIAALQR